MTVVASDRLKQREGVARVRDDQQARGVDDPIRAPSAPQFHTLDRLAYSRPPLRY
jgi:hypothetical protein